MPQGTQPIDKAEMEEINPDAIVWDGFDSAIVGYAYRCGMEPVVLYDRKRMIQALVTQGMQWQGAEEYLSFNVEGAWVGDNTPMIAVMS